MTKKCKRTGKEFTFFFGCHTVLSQWHPYTFKVDGVEYNCAEQYMMHKKACEYIFTKDSVQLALDLSSMCTSAVKEN